MYENKKELISKLVLKLNNYSGRSLKFMEVCGTHTMSIFKHGIREILPKSIKLISGPGCPVCVTPQSYIDNIIKIANLGDIVVTFGDMIRVPGTENSLEKVRASGAQVKVVYSPLDVLNIAIQNPNKRVVFAAVGFETTSPVISLTVKKAKEMKIDNLSFLCGMKLIIPALKVLCEDGTLKIDGFLLPGHVSAVLGEKPYDFLTSQYSKACVISGFEAEDILISLNLLVNQIEQNNFFVENAYKRVVNKEGNKKAFDTIFEVFEETDSFWRGIGIIKNSGLILKEEYSYFDAKSIYSLSEDYDYQPNGCACGDVIKGLKNPNECRLFDKVCTPLNPIGACMVSSEGTCAAYYKYKKL